MAPPVRCSWAHALATQRKPPARPQTPGARSAAGTAVPLSAKSPDDELRAFLLDHFLGDEDLARESEAARGAAHYDTDSYWVGAWGLLRRLRREGFGGIWLAERQTSRAGQCCRLSTDHRTNAAQLGGRVVRGFWWGGWASPAQPLTPKHPHQTQTNPPMQPLPRQRDLGELTVKRFLLLALLLDRVASDAAAARIPVPLLFRVDSDIKSSGEVG